MSRSSRKVELTRIRPEMSDVLLNWRNSPAIYQWCRQNDVIHPDAHAKWMKRQAEDPSMTMYMIQELCEADPNGGALLVGVCGLTSIDHVNSRAEFSLYISPSLHGKGYGEASLNALIAKGFDVYNLNTIWGEAFDGNPAMRMFKRVGFKEEGRRRQFYFRDGRYVDAVLFSITRDEYHARVFRDDSPDDFVPLPIGNSQNVLSPLPQTGGPHDWFGFFDQTHI